MIRDHPLTGLGLDNFLYYYPEYILPEALAEPNLSHPHNILLEALYELGVLGAIRTEVGGGYLVGSTNIADGRWHHVVSLFNGTNVTR
jgi:hypothetical protein